ncbi:MAG TPA: heme-binding protein [Chthoniobacterales bacterium]|nr:heme-binding protein [Chthoniobacterales bacterium]
MSILRGFGILVGQRRPDLLIASTVKFRALLIFAAVGLLAAPARAQLTAADVTTIINQAVLRAVKISPNSVITVTDREGYVLGVWVVRGGPATPGEIATAVSKAGTAAYLSSNQNAFTSRTAGYIIQQHFPVGVKNTAPGPLVGVGLSNLFVSDVNHFKKTDLLVCPNPPPTAAPPSPGTFGSPIAFTSLDGSPGGVPLYKGGVLVGGIGVTGDGTPQPPIPYLPTPPFPPFAACIFASLPPPGVNAREENPFVYIAGSDPDEDVALAGQKGFAPASSITANNVFVGGIRLPYVGSVSTARTKGVAVVTGNVDPQFPIVSSPPPFPYPTATFGGVDGQIRQPIISDPLVAPIMGQPRLTAAEVASIIEFAAHRVKITRAAIRLPIGTQMEAFITVVNNPDADNVAPTVLGAFRTGEATLFSWDVAVQKARTSVFYTRHDFLGFGLNVAMSTRAVGFLAQKNYPPGIDGNSAGPFFTEQDKLSGFAGVEPNLIFTATFDPSSPPLRTGIRADLPNGITIFPGGIPLYRNGVLVGAIGISGDGVDQDDIVAASGTHDFLAPDPIRSDKFNFRGARLPYVKFPRDSSL